MNQVLYKTKMDHYQYLNLNDEMVGPPPDDAKDTETASRTADILVRELLQGEEAADLLRREAEKRPEPVKMADLPKLEGRASRRRALLHDMLNTATPVSMQAEDMIDVQDEALDHVQREMADHIPVDVELAEESMGVDAQLRAALCHADEDEAAHEASAEAGRSGVVRALFSKIGWTRGQA